MTWLKRVALVAIGALALLSPAAAAQLPAPTVRFSVEPVGTFAPDGETVTIAFTVECAPGGT